MIKSTITLSVIGHEPNIYEIPFHFTPQQILSQIKRILIDTYGEYPSGTTFFISDVYPIQILN